MTSHYAALDRAYHRLPTAQITGLNARWVGPLVDQGFDTWLGELSEAAYGHLEVCGWQEALEEAPPMHRDSGRIDRAWVAAVQEAARRLADEGGYAGPEGSAERWASWLVFELSEPHTWVRDRIEKRRASQRARRAAQRASQVG